MTREVVECVLRATERIEAVEDVSVKTRHSRIVWMGVRRSGPPSRTKMSAYVFCCSRSPVLTRPLYIQILQVVRQPGKTRWVYWHDRRI